MNRSRYREMMTRLMPAEHLCFFMLCGFAAFRCALYGPDLLVPWLGS